MDWLYRLFDAMETFYQERWTILFKNKEYLELYQTVWYNSLRNLSYEQIKEGLRKCRDLSRIRFSKPPHNIEFYHWCLKMEYRKVEKKVNRYVPRRT